MMKIDVTADVYKLESDRDTNYNYIEDRDCSYHFISFQKVSLTKVIGIIDFLALVVVNLR